MGYKLLGWIVWNGGRWYLRRKLGRRGPALGAAGAVAVGVALLAGARRRAGSGSLR